MSRNSAYLNCCQLMLEDLDIDYSGSVSFLWKKGKKHTASSTWQVQTNEPLALRQTMELNLKLYKEGSSFQPKNTHLYVLNSDDQQIASFYLPVHEWTPDFNRKDIQIHKAGRKMGMLTVRARRREIMELDNFSKFRGQYEDSSEGETGGRAECLTMENNVNSRELHRFKRELEDANFLNEKLRRDRTEVLTRNDVLEQELQELKSGIFAEMKRLGEYHQKKLNAHAAIYKEEIQSLVSTFNDNSATNHTLMRQLIEENEGLQADKIDLQADKMDLQRISEEELQDQQDTYENKLYEAEEKNLDLSSQNAALQDQNSASQRENRGLREQLEEAMVQMSSLEKKTKEEKAEFQKMMDLMKEDKSALEERMRGLERERVEANVAIKEKMEEIGGLERKVKRLEENLEGTEREFEAEKTNCLKQEAAILDKNIQCEKLMVDIENLRGDKQQMDLYNKDLLKEMEKKDNDYRQELLEGERKNMEHIDELDRQITELNQRILDQDQANYSLESKLQESEMNLHIQTAQSEELENKANLLESEKEELSKELNEILIEEYSKNEEYEKKIIMLENLNENLNNTYKQMENEMNEGREKIKESYEEYIKNNEDQNQYYEQKLRKNEEEVHTLILTHDKEIDNFKKELQKINDQNLESFKKLGKADLIIHKLELDLKESEEILQETRNQMKENDLSHEQILKMVYCNNKDSIKILQQTPQANKGSNNPKPMLDIESVCAPAGNDSEAENNKSVGQGESKDRGLKSSRTDSQVDKEKREQNIDLDQEREKIRKEVEEVIRREFAMKLEKELFSQRQKLEKDMEKQAKSAGGASQQPHKQAGGVSQQSHKQAGGISQQPHKQEGGISQLDHCKQDMELEDLHAYQIHEFQNTIVSLQQQISEHAERQERDLITISRLSQNLIDSQMKTEDLRSLVAQQRSQREHREEIQENGSNCIIGLGQAEKLDKQQLKERGELDRQQLKERGELDRQKQKIKELQKTIQELESQCKSKQTIFTAHKEVQYESGQKSLSQSIAANTRPIEARIPQKRRQDSPRDLRQDSQRDRRQDSYNGYGQQKVAVIPSMVLADASELQHYLGYGNESMLKEQAQEEIGKKQQQMDELVVRNKELQRQCQRMKKELQLQQESEKQLLQNQEVRYKELCKNESRSTSALKDELGEKQRQFKEMRHQSELNKGKLAFQNERLEEEVKRLKRDLQQHEKNEWRNKDRRSDVLEDEVQENNRQILELRRQANQSRLERDGLEDEIRVLRKKQADHEKHERDFTEQCLAQDQEVQDLKRKCNRLKREAEEQQEEAARLKEQNKKAQEEVALFNSYSSQSLSNKKKFLDQKFELESQVGKRDIEIKKLEKTLADWKIKQEEEDGVRREKRNQQAKQLDTLKAELERNSHALKMSEEEARSLKNQIDTMQRESSLRLEENSLIYGDKLKLYVSQIANIKAVLDETMEEMREVRSKNTILVEELDGLRCNYEQLLIQEQQAVQDNQNNKEQLEEERSSGGELKKENDLLHQDSISLHGLVGELQEQVAKQRMVSLKKSEKVEEYEILSEKYLYELKNLKVAVGEYRDREDINSTLQRAIGQLEQENVKATEQSIRVAREFQKYRSLYLYTEAQINELVGELENTAQENKAEQIRQARESLGRQFEQKTAKMEKQLLELYNDNARLGSQVQEKEDEYADLMATHAEVEPYVRRFGTLRTDCEVMQEELKKLKQLNLEERNRAERTEIRASESERQANSLGHELQMARSSLSNEVSKCKRVEEELKEVQTGYRLEKEELSKLKKQRGEKTEGLMNQLQEVENKLLGAELENSRIREREERVHQEHKEKVRKMESKLKEALETMDKLSKELEEDFTAKITAKDNLIKNLTKEAESAKESMKRLQTEYETLLKESDELEAEVSVTRAQLEEDEELYIQEINKLKLSIKDMEEVYGMNISNMEEELADLNRELTQEKLRNRDKEEMKNSWLHESEADRRYEEKMRNRDLKIQELKENVFMLEETVINIRKKYESNSERASSGGAKYRELYSELQAELERERAQFDGERSKMQESHKSMKKEVQRFSDTNQALNLAIDQRNFELDSVKCELQTVRELYSSLQREIDRRKLKLGEQMELHSAYEREMQLKNVRISELEEKTVYLSSEIDSITRRLQKKEQELTLREELLENQQTAAKKNQALSTHSKAVEETARRQNVLLGQEAKRLEGQNQKLISQNQALKVQVSELEAECGQAVTQCKTLQLRADSLEKQMRMVQEQALKYSNVNERCLENHGVGVEELILKGLIDQKMFDQEQQINQLAEELEEMKFNQDHKLMDLEELRRTNFELELKLEDHEFMGEQVNGLRKICDKLEDEKKRAVFREEAIRIRLSNLVQGRLQGIENEYLEGIQAILEANHDIYT